MQTTAPQKKDLTCVFDVCACVEELTSLLKELRNHVLSTISKSFSWKMDIFFYVLIAYVKYLREYTSIKDPLSSTTGMELILPGTEI